MSHNEIDDEFTMTEEDFGTIAQKRKPIVTEPKPKAEQIQNTVSVNDEYLRYWDFHRTADEWIELNEKEAEYEQRFGEHISFDTDHTYTITHFNNQSFIVVGFWSKSWGELPKQVWFTIINNLIYLSYINLREHAVPIIPEKTGQYRKQIRIRIPAAIRRQLELDKFNKIKIHQVKEGIFELTPLNKDTGVRHYEYSSENHRKTCEEFGKDIYKLAIQFYNKKQEEERIAKFQEQRMNIYKQPPEDLTDEFGCPIEPPSAKPITTQEEDPDF